MQTIICHKEEGVEFYVTLLTEREERVTHFARRYKMFCVDFPRLPKEKYPDGLESDEFDEHSLLFNAYRDGSDEVLGTFRLTPVRKGCFLFGHEFNGTSYVLPREHKGATVDASTTVEASRWIGPHYLLPSGARFLVSSLLLEAGMLVSEDMGFRHWICAISESAVVNLRSDGLDFVQTISGTFLYYDDSVEICILGLGEFSFFFRRTIPSKK